MKRETTSRTTRLDSLTHFLRLIFRRRSPNQRRPAATACLTFSWHFETAVFEWLMLTFRRLVSTCDSVARILAIASFEAFLPSARSMREATPGDEGAKADAALDNESSRAILVDTALLFLPRGDSLRAVLANLGTAIPCPST
jgi:hypothetical protein